MILHIKESDITREDEGTAETAKRVANGVKGSFLPCPFCNGALDVAIMDNGKKCQAGCDSCNFYTPNVSSIEGVAYVLRIIKGYVAIPAPSVTVAQHVIDTLSKKGIDAFPTLKVFIRTKEGERILNQLLSIFVDLEQSRTLQQ